MRSAVADYEVVEEVGESLYRARAPLRLGLDDGHVTVFEVVVDSSKWAALTETLARFASLQSEPLLRLIEVAPDLDPSGRGGFLVAEAITGGVLADLVVKLSVAERVDAIARAARGAHLLHEAGLAHGSIGLGSIFLTDRGSVLGPPLPSGPEGVVARTDQWANLVTVDPGLLRGERPSRSSDIWALAATLHAAVSPVPLYPGIDDDQPVTAVQRVMFSKPSLDAGLPEAVAVLLEACFDPDPAARPSTAQEFADGLLHAEVDR